MKKMMLFDREEVLARMRTYENSLKNNAADIDFLREIEQDLIIDIYDVQTIDIFGVRYLKVLYCEDDE